MSPLVLITKALGALKTKEAWYDFHYRFWHSIDKKEISIDLLHRSRGALAFLAREFEKELLKACKHPKTYRTELYENCEDCRASRSREPLDGHFVTHTEWSNWGFW